MRTSIVLATIVVTTAACSRDRDRDRGAAPTPGPASTTAPPPVEARPAAADPALIARGDYLVNVVMNCGGCHTPLGADGRPDAARRLAGGLEIKEPFGTWRSPNITQDRRTGIGDWSDAQIAAAIREGVRPSGEHLYAIMPYTLFHDLAADDTRAVVAYLRTVPAVEHVVAGNTDLKLPRVPMPPAEGRAPGASPVERGRYLASLMMCGHCHTPIGADGAPDLAFAMAGGQTFDVPPFMGTGTVISPNLTGDRATGIGDRTDEELGRTITKMIKHDGTPVAGPMALAGAPWGHLAPDDLAALIAYLRSLPPIVHEVPRGTFVPVRS